MFYRISFNEYAGQEVESEIMYPARHYYYRVIEQLHNTAQAAEFFCIGERKRIEYQPGIYNGQQCDDDAQYEFIGMKPEWQEY